MRTAGPVGATYLVAGAGLEQKLKAGVLVSVRVLASPSPGKYLVQVSGQRLKAAGLTATGPQGLNPGSVFGARVEKTGSGLVLHALARSAAGPAEVAGILARAGLPDDSLSRFALTALLREGMAAESRSLARVRKAAQGALGSSADEEGGSPGRARLAARMEAKGIAAEEGLLDAVFGQSGMDARAGGGGDRGDQAGGPGRGGAAEPGDPPSAGAGASIPEGDLPRVLGRILGDMVMRAGGEGSLLNFFNHAKGTEGSWIYAPFRFDLDSVAFAGCFRVKLPILVGGPGKLEADFEAQREGAGPHRWSIELDFGFSGASSLRIRTDDERSGALGRGIPRLALELAGSDCSVSLLPAGSGGEAVDAAGLDLDA